MKSLRVTKIVKEIKFEWVWGELEAKNCFQIQALTKYLRLTRVFMGHSTLRETFNFCFPRVFLSINKIFILTATLSSRLFFYEILRLS